MSLLSALFPSPISAAPPTEAAGVGLSSPGEAEPDSGSDAGDFASLLAAAIAGAQQQLTALPTEVSAKLSGDAATTAISARVATTDGQANAADTVVPSPTGSSTQPIAEGVRFVPNAPPAVEPTQSNPTSTNNSAGSTAPVANADGATTNLVDAVNEAINPATQSTPSTDAALVTAIPSFADLALAQIDSDLSAEPSELAANSARAAEATANTRPLPRSIVADLQTQATGTQFIPPTRTPANLVPISTPPVVSTPAESPSSPALPTVSFSPVATLANGRTPAVPTLVPPPQPGNALPIVDPSGRPVAAATGIDRPADPVAAKPAVPAITSLTGTTTAEVRERLADVIGEITDRPRRATSEPISENSNPATFANRLESNFAPPAKPATESPRLSQAAQVADAIVTRAEVVEKNGTTEFRMRLDPPELGHVEVRIHSTERGVRAELTVADNSIRNLVESQLPELRQRLEAAGLTIDRFDLTARDGTTGQDRQQRFVPDPDQPTPVRRAPATVARTYVPAATNGGRLDITA